MTLRRFLQENFGWDTSIFAYLTPAKPIKRGGYALLLCAQEAWDQWLNIDYDGEEWIGLRAIQLYEEGFGK